MVIGEVTKVPLWVIIMLPLDHVQSVVAETTTDPTTAATDPKAKAGGH